MNNVKLIGVLKMKKALILVLALPLLFSNSFSQKPKIVTHNDSLAYSIGYNLGKNIVSQLEYDSLFLDINLILKGYEDGIKKQNPMIPEGAIQLYIAEVQKKISEKRQREQERMEKELKEQGEKNLKEAQDFLAKNRKKPNINETSSGLQFEVLKLGSGKKPNAVSTVKVNYKGTLLDGTVFDETYSRGQPAEFSLDKVIRGFQEGLLQMPEGSKFMLYIPPDLGYGSRQVGKIPPNSLLIFEVELLEIKD